MLRLRPARSRRLAPFPLRPGPRRELDISLGSAQTQPNSAAATFLFKSETSCTQHLGDGVQLLAAAKRVRTAVSRPLMNLFVDSFEARFNDCPEIRNQLRDLLRTGEAPANEDESLPLQEGSTAPLGARFYDLNPSEWVSVAMRLDEKTTDWPGILHDSLSHAAFEHVSTFPRAHESLLGLIGFCVGSRVCDKGEVNEPLLQQSRRLSLDSGVIDPICRKVRAIYWPKGRGVEYCAILARILDEADPTKSVPFSSQTLENFVVTPMLREYAAKDLAARFLAAMANLQRAQCWGVTLGMVRGVVNGAVFGSASEADLHQRIDLVKAQVQGLLSVNFLIVEQVIRKLRAVRFHSNETTYLLRFLFTRLAGEGIGSLTSDSSSTAPFSQVRVTPLSSVDTILFLASQLLQGDILQLVPSTKGRIALFSEILSFATEALALSLTTGSSTPVKWFSNPSLWKLVLSRVPHNEVRMLLGEANCNPNWIKLDFPLSWRCGCGTDVCIAAAGCPSCSEGAGMSTWRCPQCRQHNSLQESPEESVAPQLCRSCLSSHPQLALLSELPRGPEVVPCSAGCGCLVGSDAASCQACQSPNTLQSTCCSECHSPISGLRADCAECGKPKSECIVLLVPGRNRVTSPGWSSRLRTERFGGVPDPSTAMFSVTWQCGCGAANSAEKLNCWRCSRHYQRLSFSCPQCLQQNYDPPQEREGAAENVPSVFSCNQCAALHPLSKSLAQPQLCACPNCSTVNRSTDAVCRHCEATLGSISELLALYPQGPWSCFECGATNRIQLGAGGGASLTTCSKCEAERPTSLEAFALEWSCATCRAPNLGGFACTACYSLRPGLPDGKATVRLCPQCNESTASFQKPCSCAVPCSEYRYVPWDCLKCFKRNPATALQQCSHCSHRRATEVCERCGEYHMKKACAPTSEAKLLGVLEETLLAAGSIPTQENRALMTQLSSLKPSNWLKAATVFGSILSDDKKNVTKAGRRRK
jgi:hypothetical protein